MNEIIVSEMKLEHIDEVYNIFINSLKVKWSIEDLKKELENKLARYFVALQNEKVLGFGGMWVIFDEAHITNVAVHPDHRRSGIGNLIFKDMYKFCADNNIIGITLEVRENNLTAQNFYKNLGFSVEGRRKKYYQDTGEDAIIMWNRSL
ncbi:ribosomal protein S18-alanine N-acetyltransferase [Oceanirhabdus sp. W0125-5]|uniref:ribosomal protein S18-alanine N-acetyltransferase n=1 Tax=Oceanirhabdus sp. W0125-5 TaxID=2999116 RepID=UPI0022F33792|nr:ribosomal protein S18-alanine N-acetyltransferase [Oceanirhabdus sp. W0125-5]WBW98513.1 ribosomal protein S18-alanine N-acetyltransferase [Oceanirhabdus sp. W0125-5]